jgi:tRNA nucleotidyltransferase (CCA-adding enzyme)
MEKYLKRLPQEIQRLIEIASDVAFRLKMPLYLVGGFVRDLILGVKNLDLDFVVEADGIKFAQILTRRLKARMISHKRFGTATIILEHRNKIDIASARSEVYPKPASLPVVSFGNIKDDLKRRDFTINAMAINLSSKNFGKLIDFFDGQSDLRHKRIRILHNLSFIDDPTRILRAIRFKTRYNFHIESRTLCCLKEAVKLKMLQKVEPQRLRDDLILILKEKNPIKEIKCIQKLTGFNFIEPHLYVSNKTYNFLNSMEKQILWFEKNYPQRRNLDTWLIYFVGLIDSLKIKYTENLLDRLALRKGEKKRILSFKKINLKHIRPLCRLKTTPAKIFNLLEPLSYEVILMLKTKYKNKNLQRHIEDFFEIYNGMRLSIRGEDLKRLGIAPGPYYKKIFTKVLQAKLNGEIKTRDQEIALINKYIKKI